MVRSRRSSVRPDQPFTPLLIARPLTVTKPARLQQQGKIDLLEQAVVAPIVKIALHGGERRKVLWQHPPLTTAPRDVQDRVNHTAQLGPTRSAQTFDRGTLGPARLPQACRPSSSERPPDDEPGDDDQWQGDDAAGREDRGE